MDFEDPTALGGISPVLEACPISDALITWIPADEEPLCGNAAVYAVIIIIIIIIIIIQRLQFAILIVAHLTPLCFRIDLAGC